MARVLGRGDRITPDEVAEMKRLYDEGVRILQIAELVGRSTRAVATHLGTSKPTPSGPPSKQRRIRKPEVRKPGYKIPKYMEAKTVVQMEMPTAALPQIWDDTNTLIKPPTPEQLMAGSARVRNWGRYSE